VSRTLSLPPADERLYEAGTFSLGWLVAGIAFVVVAIAVVIWAVGRPRLPKVAAASPQVVALRTRYLDHLDDLERQLVDHRLSPRALHHELSRTLRRFASDAGTAGATSMSAAALDTVGHDQVAAAIRSYEHPQFEELPDGDPWAALGIARAVVAAAVLPGGEEVDGEP
jgi:hypothetical protein